MAIRTFAALEYMTAPNYNTYCQNNGLKWLDTQATTTATFLRSDVFTTEFDSYRIIVDSYKPTNATDSLSLRMRTASGTYSGSNYYNAFTGVTFLAAAVNNGGGAQTAVTITNGVNTRSSGATIEINNLRTSYKPTFYWQSVNTDNGNTNLGGGFIQNLADYIGVELFSSGTMTCNMTIYGYRKA